MLQIHCRVFNNHESGLRCNNDLSSRAFVDLLQNICLILCVCLEIARCAIGVHHHQQQIRMVMCCRQRNQRADVLVVEVLFSSGGSDKSLAILRNANWFVPCWLPLIRCAMCFNAVEAPVVLYRIAVRDTRRICVLRVTSGFCSVRLC